MLKKIYKANMCGNTFWTKLVYFPRTLKYTLKEYRYFLKHGFTYEARYNNDLWFADIMVDILTEYRDKMTGYNDRLFKSEEEWIEIIDKMIACLNVLKKFDAEQEEKEKYKCIFFGLYSKYFFELWG